MFILCIIISLCVGLILGYYFSVIKNKNKFKFYEDIRKLIYFKPTNYGEWIRAKKSIRNAFPALCMAAPEKNNIIGKHETKTVDFPLKAIKTTIMKGIKNG